MTESNRPLPLTRRVLSPESQTRPVGPCCGSRTHLAGLEDRDLADRPSMDGAVGWNRTSGLHVTNALLCRLSYDSRLVLAVGRARPKAARSRLPFGAAVARRANQRGTATVSTAYKTEPARLRPLDSALRCLARLRRYGARLRFRKPVLATGLVDSPRLWTPQATQVACSALRADVLALLRYHDRWPREMDLNHRFRFRRPASFR